MLEYIFVRYDNTDEDSLVIMRFIDENIEDLNERNVYFGIYKITDAMMQDDETVSQMKAHGVTSLPCCICKSGSIVGKRDILNRYTQLLRKVATKAATRDVSLESYMETIALDNSNDNEPDMMHEDAPVSMDDYAKKVGKYKGAPPKRVSAAAPVAADDDDFDVFKKYAEADL
jgi:hypothetical protein